MGRRLRALEFTVMFVAAPATCAVVFRGAGWLFPALWLLGATCLALLLSDRSFERRRLWRGGLTRRHVRGIFVRFAVIAPLIVAAVAVRDAVAGGRPVLFSLPLERPGLWAIIMVGYPVLSVYPQELAWRTFLFHRYARLFRSPAAMVVASAVAFGFAHVVLHNALAVAMTLAGGVLFAMTYLRTGSTLAAAIEHALYGCLVFTVGLGRYFYSGAVPP